MISAATRVESEIFYLTIIMPRVAMDG